jgi:N-acetylglucosaminyldiphosphoundecaprenol N-acetyl-beta-D-mannosaminyltransferase
VSLSSTLLTAPTKEARANVLGVGVHAVDLTRAADCIESALLARQRGYVCVTGVHGVMEAHRDAEFRDILDRALLVVPDGMPTVWVGRAQGLGQISRVFGPDLMEEVCRRSVEKSFTHFLYGGKPGVGEELKRNLEQWFPNIRIVGTFTPPFRPLAANELAEVEKLIARVRPDIIWVGLSTPKQERFMSEFVSRLPFGVMIGVGAAFDIHTGRLKDAPEWVKKTGLQWVHRLCQEPSRLWRRYLVNNSRFLWRLLLQFSGLATYKLPPD